MSLYEKLAKLQLLVLDFDGVLTDDCAYVNDKGEEFVRYCHRDGQGIYAVKNLAIPVMVISGQRSHYVSARCRKMNIDCYQAIDDKLKCLKAILKDGFPMISPGNVCYVGNDVGDLEVMKFVGIPIAVGDAEESIKEASVCVTSKNGGNGAVREVCEMILKAKGVLCER